MNTTRSRWTHCITGVALFAVVSAGAVGCSGDSAGPETGADVGDIATRYFAGNEYVGKTVTVSAEVSDVISPTSFELAGGEYGDQTVLVVSSRPVSGISEGQPVQVTGTVRLFGYENFATDYGLSQDPNRYMPYAEEAVLVASSIKTTVPPEGSGG